MAASETLRYRADTQMTYSHAVIALTEYARSHKDEYDYGPLDLASLVSGGLVVTGPDLEGVAALLAGIPGLAESEA